MLLCPCNQVMNARPGDNKSQVFPSVVLYPFPHLLCCASHHLPFQACAVRGTAPNPSRKESLASQITAFQACIWTSLRLKDWYHTTQGQAETQGSTSLGAQRVVCPTQPHAAAVSTHGACLSTAQAAAHRGSVSVCAAQTGTKHKALRVWVCFHPLMLQVSRCHSLENDFSASVQQRLLKKQLSLRSASHLLKASCSKPKAIGLCTFVISTQQ